MKRTKIVVCVAIILVLTIAVLVSSGNKDRVINKIRRPGYNEAVKSHSLTAKIDDEEYTVQIDVNPMKISEENMQSCFDEAYEIICEEMKGKNTSLNEVRSDLVFVEEIERYGIKVSYTVSDYSIVSSTGVVKNDSLPKSGTECEITANLEYENLLQSYKIKIVVFPPNYTDEELFVNGLQDEIKKENSKKGEEYFQLPNEINGKKVSFVEKAESRLPIVVIMIMFIALLWYYRTFVVKRNQEKIREELLQADYADIVSKLSLLMGAGMSSYNALSKICADYKVNGIKNGRKRPAYDELTATINRISSGVSETEAYAMLGRVCKTHSYIRLGSILAQNVRKGGEGFIESVKEEVTEAMVEKKNRARKMGEEAGTKLLLPMGMMLCVVMVVIIVPAFMSF